MYGMLPIFQGPIAVSMGGVDLSWLAGGLTSAAVYAALGPVVAAKYDKAAARQIPAPRSGRAADVVTPAGASAAPEVVA
jgi:toxin CptA